MKRVVPILCPTRDHRGAMAGSMVAMLNVIYAIDRIPLYIQRGAYGYAAVRNKVFADTREELSKAIGKPITTARGFLIDDDVLIVNPAELLAVVKQADKLECSIVAPCLLDMNNGEEQFTNISVHTDVGTQLLTEGQVEKLELWSKVQLAGLGFYYGDIPLDYHFHENGRGEDINFFDDNKDRLDVRLAPLHLKHYKRVLL